MLTEDAIPTTLPPPNPLPEHELPQVHAWHPQRYNNARASQRRLASTSPLRRRDLQTRLDSQRRDRHQRRLPHPRPHQQQPQMAAMTPHPPAIGAEKHSSLTAGPRRPLAPALPPPPEWKREPPASSSRRRSPPGERGRGVSWGFLRHRQREGCLETRTRAHHHQEEEGRP